MKLDLAGRRLVIIDLLVYLCWFVHKYLLDLQRLGLHSRKVCLLPLGDWWVIHINMKTQIDFSSKNEGFIVAYQICSKGMHACTVHTGSPWKNEKKRITYPLLCQSGSSVQHETHKSEKPVKIQIYVLFLLFARLFLVYYFTKSSENWPR